MVLFFSHECVWILVWKILSFLTQNISYKKTEFLESFFFFLQHSWKRSRKIYQPKDKHWKGFKFFFFSFDGTTCKLIFICREYLDPGPKKDKLSTATRRMYLRKSLCEKAKLKRLFWSQLTVGCRDSSKNYRLKRVRLKWSAAYYYEPINFTVTRVCDRPSTRCPAPQTRVKQHRR